jgi:uncharacterized protein YjbI with pentapeptide repeats
MTQTVSATPKEIMDWYARGRRKFDGVSIAGCYATFDGCDLSYSIFSNAQLDGACLSVLT